MTTFRTTTPPPTGPAPTAPPAAVRAQSPGWRDPRLLVGVVIVAACVLLGAKIFAQADDTVSVWSVRHDVAAGSVVTADDLVAVRVHLTGAASDRYLPATTVPAAGSTVAHDLAAGELLPRSAVRADAGPALVEVPLSVAPDDLPASVHRGAVVDVWVTPKVPATTGDDRPRAKLALDDVVVVAVPASRDRLAPSTTQQVIVGVDESQADDLAEALGQLADGRVVLTRQAGS